ncbi:MAG: GIY-YIG nuclease family protein [Candidatus Absconditabacteria bacterium]|nr:GIY-YIG nuclease family protein [Candidatus Absconditabacteria bacterium]MDD3868798.1 GIY-YIG nuclease family protein [Candidatus Absconditabacteria bacterium]MDD4714187.1 GIY-YIG nuclease family protein [Candidatus Absconditabacteria bacterium]
MSEKRGFVYILTNKRNGTLYIGVTANLEKRMYEHRSKLIPGFTARYGIDKLVWFQELPTIQEAIEYEKKLKGRVRKKKIDLIEQENSCREDLFESL